MNIFDDGDETIEELPEPICPLIETDPPPIGYLTLSQAAKHLRLPEDHVRGLQTLYEHVSKATGEEYFSGIAVREFRAGMDRWRTRS
jgi:hypothetical protein